MRHVVMFSGGVGSYLTAKRVVSEHGADRTLLLFADTKIEDPDLYRFIHQAAAVLDVHLEVIADGRTPWEVFHDHKFIGNTRVDICSRALKRDLMDKWISDRFTPDQVQCYVGVDWTEQHRYDRLAPRKLPYIYKAPLCDPPFYNGKDEMLAELEADGLRLPRLYELGFPHNNCGGFCVKAGHGTFKMLLEKLPERYAEHEAQEQRLRDHIGKPVAILRDRRGGRTRPMSLKEFRERVQGGEKVDTDDHGGCGCAID